MRAIRIIYRRELGTYLRSPFGWVIAAILLVIDGILFQGYTNGSFVQMNATTWEIRSDAATETIFFTNSAAIDGSDYSFV